MKTVLITGASAGLGKALALQFASRGHNLVLVARREDLLQSVKKQIEDRFTVKVFVRSVDVADEAALRLAVKDASALLGTVDTVIANAGFGVEGPFEKLTVADFERQFEVNVFGMLKTVYATLAGLKISKGRICLIGSTSAYLSLPGVVPYSMSKYAVRALAEGLHAELGRLGISVTLINPGFIATEIRKVKGQDPIPSWLTMDAGKAARKIYRAVARRKRERAVTIHSQLGIWAARFLPGFVAFVLRRVSKPI